MLKNKDAALGVDDRLQAIRTRLAAERFPVTDVCSECGRKNEVPSLPPKSPELSARIERALNLGLVNVGHDVPVNAVALTAVSKAIERAMPWRRRLRFVFGQRLRKLGMWIIDYANRM
jgi:hypothetical protein